MQFFKNSLHLDEMIFFLQENVKSTQINESTFPSIYKNYKNWAKMF